MRYIKSNNRTVKVFVTDNREEYWVKRIILYSNQMIYLSYKYQIPLHICLN